MSSNIDLVEAFIRREALKDELVKYSPAFENIRKVKYKIAVMSGKGGVGKTTISINIAASLKMKGYSVGIFDVDVHGPSVPSLLGIKEKTDLMGHHLYLKPLTSKHGIKVMSVELMWPGTFVPVMWKGPYKARAIRQLMAATVWGDLEFLVIDMPPGTGDEHITILKSVPGLNGVVFVTTPHNPVQQTVGRAINCAKELRVPILGVIENMSTFICPHCGGSIRIFGHGGGRRIAEALEVPFLGEVPLDIHIVKAAEEKEPVVIKYPNAPSSIAIKNITDKILKMIIK